MPTSAASHSADVTIDATKQTSRPSDRAFILVMAGIMALVVVGIVVLLSWSRSRTSALVEAVTSFRPATLLPLAIPVNPVIGRYEINNLPSKSQLQPRVLAAGAPQPDVDLPLVSWDWGTIPATETVEQTFPIQNMGNRPLIITSVVTSCGCTVALLSSSVIPAGQRANLKVEFDPGYHETNGPVTRLVWIRTNDPDRPLLEIRLDANVTP